MLKWKIAAKSYRQVATDLMNLLRTERALRVAQTVIIEALQEYKTVVTKPKTPFVRLVAGQDINIEKAQQKLFKTLEVYDNLIQTYSQNNSQNDPLEKLDNAPSV